MPDHDLRRALAYIAPYWRRLVLVVLLSLLGTALSLALPYLSKALVDQALIGGDAGALVRIVMAFTGLTLASFALNVVSGLRYTRVSAEILFDMRLALFRHLQRLSPRFFARMPLGQIASRINSDIGEIQRVAAEVALAWLGNVLFLGGTIVILLLLDPLLFAVSLALLPPALWALVRYRRRLGGAIAEMRERSAGVGTFLIETLQGMRLVVSLNAQEREVARFRERNDAFIDSLMGMRRLTYLSGGLPGLLLSAGSAVVFLVGGWRVISGAITLGTLVAFVAYQMRLLGPIQALMDLYASIATARVSLRRVNEILDAPVEVVERAGARQLRSARGELRFEGVKFAFDGEAPVLEGLDLTVGAGERVAIVGASGGGKSTIADLLIRQLDPAAGCIRLDGHDLRELRLADLRRHVVVVDQEPFVFNAPLAENIRYARPGATDADVMAAARAAGLGGLIDRLAVGIDSLAGERGRSLSAGERQRLAIARAFLADPAVLVLDEATGALDPATEAQVIAGYEAVMERRTTIVISHRAELARRADRVVVLERGRIAEEGAADALAASGGAYADLFPPPHLVR
ncbi:MAG TPA: ABC transporter ATP-binding protein [Gemmatimonadaceae bacterium]|nr:ABC transporter ATP-binding protein [Gemmatimonadaceae bacterium]